MTLWQILCGVNVVLFGIAAVLNFSKNRPPTKALTLILYLNCMWYYFKEAMLIGCGG